MPSIRYQEANEWLRQSRLNTYNAECQVVVKGAWNNMINGEYGMTPETYEHRPVFERLFTENNERFRVTMFLDETEGTYSRWYISKRDGEVGRLSDTLALIQSGALTPDGATDFEKWQEYHPKDGIVKENAQLTVEGDCAKVREHDWRRRRRKRKEERKKRRAVEANSEKHCPQDITVRSDPGNSYAVVHWSPWSQKGPDDDEMDVIYDEGSLAPGSQFPIGRTAVTYSLSQAGKIFARCDFMVQIRDEEPPTIDCPGDIYVMTIFNRNVGVAQWTEPDARDNSDDVNDDGVSLVKTSGPERGEELKVGRYRIIYEGSDPFGNKGICQFDLVVADRQAPKIHRCPANQKILVFEDTGWSAYPEWDTPTAEDAVDGKIEVRQVTGGPSGSMLSIAALTDSKGKEIRSKEFKNVYEATDGSGNSARCTFRITLAKDDDHSVAHSEIHTKLGVQKEMADEEMEKLENKAFLHAQDSKWTSKAKKLRDAKEAKRKRRKERKNRRKLGAHRAKAKTRGASATRNIIDEMRGKGDDYEDEEFYPSPPKKKGLTRVFWILITPWRWPWPAFIPFFVLSIFGMLIVIFLHSPFPSHIFCVFFLIACGAGMYVLVTEIRRPRGKRVPSYNSIWYKLTDWSKFKRKSKRQIV